MTKLTELTEPSDWSCAGYFPGHGVWMPRNKTNGSVPPAAGAAVRVVAEPRELEGRGGGGPVRPGRGRQGQSVIQTPPRIVS
jgi:hypothetical protein